MLSTDTSKSNSMLGTFCGTCPEGICLHSCRREWRMAMSELWRSEQTRAIEKLRIAGYGLFLRLPEGSRRVGTSPKVPSLSKARALSIESEPS